MTNPKDVLESLAWKHEPAQRGGHYRPAETTGAKTANPDSGSAADDLGLCVEAPKENTQPPNSRVSDLEDALYRARCLVLSARQTAAETRAAGLTEQVVQRTGAEPAGVPILLIVEVLFALIRFVRARRESPADRAELSRLLDKLKPYQPVRPAWKEAE